MLWCKRAQIICGLVIISACGFQPVLKKGATSLLESEMRYIEITPIADRIGQMLRSHLVQEITPLGKSRTTKYKLRVTLKETKQNLAIKKSEVATRANLYFVAIYELTMKSNGRLLVKGRSHMTTSFNILNEPFSTMVFRHRP
jgi:LPS-assembly lipoprotein